MDNAYRLRLHLVKCVEVEKVENIGHLFLFYEVVADRPPRLQFHKDELILCQLELETIEGPVNISPQPFTQDGASPVRIVCDKRVGVRKGSHEPLD